MWDERFMNLACHVSSWSKDPSTKVGAVIVGERKMVSSLGYNGFPRGVEDNPQRYDDREIKYRLVSHAERNALDNAECSVVGHTLYVTRHPCSECAKSIVQRGISRVVYESHPEFELRWSADLRIARMILDEGGVRVDERQ
jgi:dCMP deaminase